MMFFAGFVFGALAMAIVFAVLSEDGPGPKPPRLRIFQERPELPLPV